MIALLTMKVLLLLVLVGSARALAVEPIGRFYHKDVGIPRAAAIKAEEEKQAAAVRIVGGSNSRIGQQPYFAGLLIYLSTGQTSVCGASLLSNTKLVTAAHCVNDGLYKAAQMEVVLGSINLFGSGTRVLATNATVHSGYNPLNLANDVAILTIPMVNFTGNIKPISLPSRAQLNNSFAGSTAHAVGYGKTADWAGITTSQRLSYVNLKVIANADCAAVYGNSVVTSGTICTSAVAGANTCSGDSGGPLSVRNSTGQDMLIGIVSFGSSLGCQSGLPSGYTRVSAQAAWIQAKL